MALLAWILLLQPEQVVRSADAASTTTDEIPVPVKELAVNSDAQNVRTHRFRNLAAAGAVVVGLTGCATKTCIDGISGVTSIPGAEVFAPLVIVACAGAASELSQMASLAETATAVAAAEENAPESSSEAARGRQRTTGPDPEEVARITSMDELRKLLSDSTASGRSESAVEFTVRHHADGRMAAMTTTGQEDEGIWEITRDGRYCRQWRSWRNGARDCFDVYRLDDERFEFRGVDKPYSSTVSLKPTEP